MEQPKRPFFFSILSPNFTFTKRQLGILLFCVGVVGVIGILSIDLLRVGREGGVGPAQKAALLTMGTVALLGLSLIPLGDHLA